MITYTGQHSGIEVVFKHHSTSMTKDLLTMMMTDMKIACAVDH
jgi:hypothetical protein